MTNDHCPGRFNSVSDLAGVVADVLQSVGWWQAGHGFVTAALSLSLTPGGLEDR